MAVNWTKDQKKVIDLNCRNILVSAAAGSGKTAVLVERIIRLISEGEHPTDIDRLLIVTFTRAAASEMRERIGQAIEKKLEQEPDNEHLQKQETLLHNAQIMTIDSFCQYVIRNHFQKISLDPGFSVLDEGEAKLIRQEALDELLEDRFAQKEASFVQFVETYATGKNDRGIEELVLQLYNWSQSYPWPEAWLNHCAEAYEMENEAAWQQTFWMEQLMRYVRSVLEDLLEQTKEAHEITKETGGPSTYEPMLQADEDMLAGFLKCTDYTSMSHALREQSRFVTLSRKKDPDADEALKEKVKALRDQVKKEVTNLKEQYFYQKPEHMFETMQKARIPMLVLIDLTREFSSRFQKKKKEKNKVDFNDMEHFALQILVEGEVGRPTAVAKEMAERYTEVMIDEYQDSNLVQDLLLSSVARKLFMVGDVKQSIYRFRLARPELFMEKYQNYSTEDAPDQKVELHQNFRSREEVVDGVNFFFRQIMQMSLGKVAYDDAAMLYTGADYPEPPEELSNGCELLLMNTEETSEWIPDFNQNPRELELRMIGKRIREIVGTDLVYDKDTKAYRPAEYRDIVLLFRSPSGYADTCLSIFEEMGIPAYVGSRTGYFSATEVQVVLSMLKVVDNPRQDIPLTAVMASAIGAFATDELALIRAADKEDSFYEACKKAAEQETALGKKVRAFLTLVKGFQKLVPYTPVHELLWQILQQTGYGDYAAAMPAGEQRQANLSMLMEKAVSYESTSYRGLFHFIRYIENLQKYEVDFGEANTIGEEENTVRIMSIHKSKGLEFPIVILGGLSKKFNQQDSRSRLAIHPEYGTGCDYVDIEKRTKMPTLLKKVIQKETALENLGEELRVLYVAMTRAKERLILTGTVSKMEKDMIKWSQILQHREEELPFLLLSSAGSYMDWIMPAVLRNKAAEELLEKYEIEPNVFHALYGEELRLQIQEYNMDDLFEEESTQMFGGLHTASMLLEQSDIYDSAEIKALERGRTVVYPYEKERSIPGKVSVSELKKQGMNLEEEAEELFPKPEIVPFVPDFIEKKEEGGAVRGTAIHHILEKLVFDRGGTIKELELQLQELKEKGTLSEEELNFARLPVLVHFVNSDLGKRMRQAEKYRKLYREKQFVLGVPAREIHEEWESDELVLIQGIMDAWFEEADGLVLVDYKTDRVDASEGEDILKKRYHIQLESYANALERLTGKKVKEKLIYSFWLQKEIAI